MKINGMEYLDIDSTVEKEREEKHDRLVREREDELREEGYQEAMNDVMDTLEQELGDMLLFITERISTLSFSPKGKE